jgi:nucleoside-diphosphate-sugar epimerase
MRVFITGATGFIGTQIVRELIGTGHQVTGLARSDASAKALEDAGARTHPGHLEDLESLRSGAAASDGVIHLAFIHDFSKYEENCRIDRRAIETMGAALAGSGRPFIVTSGTGMVEPGRLATEDDPPAFASDSIPRAASEEAVSAVAAKGVRASLVRLPQVHDTRVQGLVTLLIALAREKGVSAYVGDGSNRWPAAHLLDTAHLYCLVLEKGAAGARYHAVAEEGIPVREIAAVIARRLNVPLVSKSAEEAQEHFGWMAMLAGRDVPASSALTQQRMGWRPVQRGMIADLEEASSLEI